MDQPSEEYKVVINNDSLIKKQFTTVTTFSKYLALALFVVLPFIGGWIGYHYAPEKVVEVERVIVTEVETKKNVEDNFGTSLLNQETNDSEHVYQEESRMITGSFDGQLIDVTEATEKDFLPATVESCGGDWRCLFNLAIAEEDVTLCDNAGGEDRVTCVWASASKFKNLENCDYMLKYTSEEEDSRKRLLNDCYSNVGINLLDTSICELLQEDEVRQSYGRTVVSSERDECYSGIAQVTQEVDYCHEIGLASEAEFFNNKNYCYAWLASNKNDLSICEFIDDEIITSSAGSPTKDQCLDDYFR